MIYDSLRLPGHRYAPLTPQRLLSHKRLLQLTVLSAYAAQQGYKPSLMLKEKNHQRGKRTDMWYVGSHARGVFLSLRLGSGVRTHS